jgi:hypothetical protein
MTLLELGMRVCSAFIFSLILLLRLCANISHHQWGEAKRANQC